MGSAENVELVVARYIRSHYDLKVIKADKVLKGVTNSNFKVITSNGDYFFKQYNFKTGKEVIFEVGVLEELAKCNFLSPRLVADKTGHIIGKLGKKPVLLYSFIKGTVRPVWNLDLIREVGMCMGKMHRLLMHYSDKSKSRTFDLEKTRQLVEANGGRFYEAGYTGARQLLEFVKRKLSKLSFPESLPLGITHHDIKPENVLVERRTVVGIVDFDLAYYGVLLNDIATTVIWSCFEGSDLNISKLQSLINGYESERPLLPIEQEYIQEAIYFRLIREVFSSPFDVLPNYMHITKKRSDEFMRSVEQFEHVKNSSLIHFKEER